MPLPRWMERPRLWFSRHRVSPDVLPGRGPSSKMQLVHLPKFGIYVDPEDNLIGAGIIKYGKYEPYLAKLISRLLEAGQTFLDLGSNIGYHTLIAAVRVGLKGRCIAVDLNPDNCNLLRASCEFNGFSQVEVHEKAAAAETGELSFFTTPQTGNSAVLSGRIRAGMPAGPHWLKNAEQRVEAVAIDDLVGEDPVHLVKIDVEGSEARAIAGMKRILSRQRPPVIFEFFPGMLRDIGEIEPCELLDAVRSFHYDIFRIHGNGKLSKRALSNEEAMPLDGEVLSDLFAVPRR